MSVFSGVYIGTITTVSETYLLSGTYNIVEQKTHLSQLNIVYTYESEYTYV